MQPQKQDPKKQPLPPFRTDLKLFKGPDEATGSPTFNLFDPVQSRYFKINWTQSLLFQFFRGGMTPEELTDEINKNTTATVKVEGVLKFFQWAAHFGLLQQVKGADKIMEEVEKGKTNPFKWLLFHYLYFRIPLINPDKFLSKTMHFVKPLGSRPALFIYLATMVVAVMTLMPNFQLYIATFPYFFNMEGLAYFALGIICVKIIHEFAHAYTAKYYGIYVPTMGVAFLVLWPVLYTDVTHGWRLSNRKHRLAISAAGVASELVLAGFATIGWLMTEPGIFNSILFVVSSSSWITSLFINLNPALKFDGYYLLSDLWGIDNMQTRAFAMARWKLRSSLLGVKAPPPEEDLSRRTIRGMVVYSVYTWIYRIFLYTAIALFVYYKFTKVLGVFLFLVEILIFFVWPVVSEVKELRALRKYFTTNPRLLITTSLIIVLILWLVIPLPHTQSFPGIVTAVEQQILYAPYSGEIDQLLIARGDDVVSGQPLIRLRSIDLNNQIKKQQVETEILQTQTNILGQSDQYRRLVGQKKAELAKAEEELKTSRERKEDMEIIAEVSGVVADWDDKLKLSQFVRQNQTFGLIIDSGQKKVVFFVPEKNQRDLYLGQPMTFTIPQPRREYSGTITKIGQARVEELEYPQLASQNYGELPTIEPEPGTFRVVESYYPVEASLDEESGELKYGNLGTATVVGPWRSLIVEFWKTVQRVLWQESGT